MSEFHYGPDNIQTPVINDPNPPIPNAPYPNIDLFNPLTYSLPQVVFDNLINTFGVRVMWRKSHFCPCVAFNNGTALPECKSCFGRGVYWDSPLGPFTVLLASSIQMESQRSPGIDTDATYGLTQHTGPWITVGPSNGQLYDEVSVYDVFVEIDATRRLNDTLQMGVRQILSYTFDAQIVSATFFNTQTNTAQSLSNYSYDPSTGIITTDLPDLTAFTVEYYAPYAYVAFGGTGGMPHVRPFVQGQASYPKRVRTEYFDLWLRNNVGQPLIT